MHVTRRLDAPQRSRKLVLRTGACSWETHMFSQSNAGLAARPASPFRTTHSGPRSERLESSTLSAHSASVDLAVFAFEDPPVGSRVAKIAMPLNEGTL